MDQTTLLNFGLVLLFVLIGGVFAATEMALVSLRESQLAQLEKKGARGVKVASLARDPNTFLAAVQIGVTVAGFLSAAYGASTLAPDVAPLIEGLGASEGASDTIALVAMTLLIAYLSLVLGELVPKRFALQKSAPFALAVAPPLSKFATVMRPVIWFLSLSTNAVVRVLGGDPHATNEEMTEDELRDLVGSHESLEVEERQLLRDVFAATDRTLREIMRPRGAVDFLTGAASVTEALQSIRTMPHSRFPVTRDGVDDVVGFVHVRDLVEARDEGDKRVMDLVREIPVLPNTNTILPAMTHLRREGVHIALVTDEFGGTDGIVTLEDIIEELVGEIRDEYDPVAGPGQPGDATGQLDASRHVEEFEELTGIAIPHGPYATVAGFVVEQLGHVPVVGDTVQLGEHVLTVTEMDGRRVATVTVETVSADELEPAELTEEA